MIVREASRADMPWLLEQLEQFDQWFGATRSFMQDPDDICTRLSEFMAGGSVFLAEDAEGPVGFIVGAIGPHYLCPKILTLFELLWWAPSTPVGKSALVLLLDRFMEYGQAQGVDWIICSARSTVPARPTFAKRGFRTIETSHLYEVVH